MPIGKGFVIFLRKRKLWGVVPMWMGYQGRQRLAIDLILEARPFP